MTRTVTPATAATVVPVAHLTEDGEVMLTEDGEAMLLETDGVAGSGRSVVSSAITRKVL